MSSSIFWHDYETFGADAARDRPCQFAGIRTDSDLNIISDPTTIYCAPADDYLPNPEACFVTGITPQKALREGVSEAVFAKQIEALFGAPDTCVAGYNSIRFDDEVSRHLFYRNFLDPYRREWANGNSRWDLIDLVRLVYVLYPEALKWPLNEDGSASFRLERLTEENGLEHSAAHDAMSDVYATIGLAKLIKERLPKVYDWAFGFRAKAKVKKSLELTRLKPVFHVSSKFPSAFGCSSLVLPMFEHPANKNGIVCFDLRQDPSIWLGWSPVEMVRLLYSSASELKASGRSRPGLKTIHLNRCPIVLPAGTIRRVSLERQQAWGLSEEVGRVHLSKFQEMPELIEAFKQVLELDGRDDDQQTDPDVMLYSGGFFSPRDKAEIDRVSRSSLEELASAVFHFDDKRLDEMLMRYKGRNFPQSLNDEELSRWEAYKTDRLFSQNSGFLSFSEFGQRLESLYLDESLSAAHRQILDDLRYYGESIYPYGS